MHRDLLEQLINWQNDPLRVPLLLRGARQVGKSWIVNEFGKNFKSYVAINFEKEPDVKELFSGRINIDTILEKLSFYFGQKIIPKETLLFFDEIQECENCLKSLRYFKEDCPELHVIAAGSLIDFTLETIGMPVGRVQFLYLHPLSFGEFLTANGAIDLRNYLINNSKYDAIFYNKAMDFLKIYLWLGGMPAIVNSWLEHKDPIVCQKLQNRIILSYQQDFYKYAKKNAITHVENIFNNIPLQLGNKFKYVNVDPETKSFVLKQALSLLQKAGIIHICYHTSGQGVPFKASIKENKFKVFLFDIGIVQQMLKVDLKSWIVKEIIASHLGSIAEQFVAQEFVAYSSIEEPPELYYWHREAKSSNAEVDFIINKGSSVIPIEVKSGTKGGMKSIKYFLESHPNSDYGVKISENYPYEQKNIKEVSFIGIENFIKKC